MLLVAAPVDAVEGEVLDQRQVGGNLGDVACTACTAGSAELGRGSNTPHVWLLLQCHQRQHANDGSPTCPPEEKPTTSNWAPAAPTQQAQQPTFSCPPEAKPMMRTCAPQRTHFKASVSRGPPTGSNTTSTPAGRQAGRQAAGALWVLCGHMRARWRGQKTSTPAGGLAGWQALLARSACV